MYRLTNSELNKNIADNVKLEKHPVYVFKDLAGDTIKIKWFFENILDLNTVLSEFEDRFNHFTSQFPSDFKKHRIFDGYVSKSQKIPFFIPDLSEKDLNDINLAEEFRPLEDQKNILLLFLFSQLIDLNILSRDKSLDEQIIYLSELIDREILNQYILNHNVFYIDAGYRHNITHGKYIHLIQYVLLGIGLKQGVISLPVLVGSTAISGWFHSQLLKNLFSHTNKNGVSFYDLCFENFKENKIAGAPGINFFLLTGWFAEYCPNFSASFRYSYVKSMAKSWREVKSLFYNLDQYKEYLLKNIGFFKPLDIKYYKKWHHHYMGPVEHRQCHSIVHKKNRSKKFSQSEADIRTQYKYQSQKKFNYIAACQQDGDCVIL